MIIRILESWTNRPEWMALCEYAKALLLPRTEAR